MIIGFDVVGKEIILLLYFGEYPAECLIVNRAVFLCLLGDSNILLKCMGEKFCIRFFTFQKEDNKFNTGMATKSIAKYI